MLIRQASGENYSLASSSLRTIFHGFRGFAGTSPGRGLDAIPYHWVVPPERCRWTLAADRGTPNFVDSRSSLEPRQFLPSGPGSKSGQPCCPVTAVISGAGGGGLSAARRGHLRRAAPHLGANLPAL